MAHGAKDGTLIMQISVTVGSDAKVPLASEQHPIDGYGKYEGNSSTLQTLKSWTVTADREGELSTIEISCSNYSVAQFKITVAGVTVMDTNYLPESFSAEFPKQKLAAAAEVLVQVKSDGSTTIKAYCWITGKEVS